MIGKEKKDSQNEGTKHANEAEHMASIVGHEIRNALSNLTNISYLIKKEITGTLSANPASKAPRHMEIMDRAIKTIDHIVQNMLSYSSTRPPMLAECDINQIVNDVSDIIKVPENVKLDVKCSEVSEIKADAVELKLVIFNLVTNAIDSIAENEKGDVSIITKNSSDGKSVVLEILDTGCGIPEENITSIFEPFFTTKARGVGLGLTVAGKVVEKRHKGKIDVEKRPEKGTCVRITFFNEHNV